MDENLKRIISKQLIKNGGEYENITSLNISESEIKSLDGIEKLINLDCLWASKNEIKDVTPLKNLPIRSLWIYDNDISDFTPILSGSDRFTMWACDNPISYKSVGMIANNPNVTVWFGDSEDSTPSWTLRRKTNYRINTSRIKDIKASNINEHKPNIFEKFFNVLFK